MAVEQDFGVSVLVVGVSEACDTDWDSYGGEADLARVRGPDSHDWPALRAAGFVPRPERVSWLAPAPTDPHQFLSRLSRKGREDVRLAMRRATESGVVLRREGSLGAEDYERFLDLYRPQLETHRHPIPTAIWARDQILAEPERFYAVIAEAGGQMVGACIGERRPQRDAAWIRFSAVDKLRRQQSLARVLYLHAAVMAGQEGFSRVVLGNDPALYGHITEVGLISFKSRLGFVPRPSHEMTPGDGSDVADRVLKFGKLADPSVALGYQQSPLDDLAPFVFASGAAA